MDKMHVTCPDCQVVTTIAVPTDQTLIGFECSGCKEQKMASKNSCVFCSFSSDCPQHQTSTTLA